ncbi:amidohydrolase [Treponema parvum]|uniref:Amidohydrolase n=1 Tax=Treponema parvum TaxID=138851 RepID=A0A975IDQ2_9SPIR|nr:amidohydrolase family protein [Treponema parvum]QTQ13215.1 amidohydrolase [Treponema parvum]
MRCIDMFNHYLPKCFYEKITALGGNAHMMTRASRMPAMSDLSYRLRLMDTFEGYQQIPCIVSPSVEQLVPENKTAELARSANESFYELCQKYPDKFPSFVAVLPLDNMDKAAKEAEYAVTQLGAAGAQIFTNQGGSAIDSDEFYKLYKVLDELEAALWVHPARTQSQPYYKNETEERYELWWTMMWPIETTMAASRLVYSGINQRCPRLKVILHHAGGMLPMMEGRLENGLKLYGTRTAQDKKDLTESPIKEKCQIDEFRKLYADCATFGSKAAIQCGINFFGAEHMVFASDMPFDPEDGFGYVRRTLNDIANLPISEKEKDALRYTNALKILKRIF